MSTDVSKKRDLSLVHFLIMLLIIFGIGALKPLGAITPLGMKMMGVFLGLLYGWITSGMLWPSLVGWFAIATTGIMESPKAVFMAGFNSDIIIFMLFILVLVQMLSDSGAINNVVNFIITRPFLRGRPWTFSFVFLFACGLLASLGQAYAAFFLGWGLLFGIFEKVGYKPYDLYAGVMIIGVVASAMPFGLMFPFKDIPLALLSIFTSITGIAINYLLYMAVMIPTGILILLGYVLLCKYILRPDVSKMKNFDIDLLKAENAQITRHQKATLIAFLFALICLLIPGSLPKTWAITQLFTSYGMAGPMVICTTLFCVIKVDGKPILDFPQSARSGINWAIMFMMVTLMLMSSLLLSDATGIKQFLVDVLGPLLTHFSGVAFLVILALIMIVLTNFMNNIIVGIMFIPVLATFYASTGANPIVGFLLIVLSINAAFLTPASSPASAMCFSRTDWINTKDIFKIMVIMVVTCVIIGVPMILLLGSLIF